MKAIWATHVIFILLTVILIGARYKPAYNWDILPYMALALNHSVTDKDSVHKQVYQLIKEGQGKGEIPNGTFGELTKRLPYRVACYENADKFNAQLFYYRTKPLYNLLVYWLYLVGVPLIQATVIPSLVAGFIIILVMYAWMSLYTHRIIAAIIALLILLLPSFSELHNTSSPDALSAMFVLGAMYLFFAGKRKTWIFLCLALAVLVRIDNFIFAAAMVYVISKPGKNKLLFIAAGSVIAALVAMLIIPWLSGNSLMWFTEFKFLESHVQYYFHVRNVFRDLLASSHLLLWVILGVILLMVKDKQVRSLMLIILSCTVIRLILFPSLQERFFIPYELALITALMIAVKGKAPQPGIN